jgi:peptidoglycan/LPS O-acetylase OafA/YrhL
MAAPARGSRRLSGHTNLDVLRGVSALCVAVGHAALLSPFVDPFQANVNTLVFLFFGLSGYLITAPYLQALLAGAPSPAVGPYAVRRAARIFPAYLLALGGLSLIKGPPDVWTAVSHAALVQDLVPGQAESWYPVAWTLGLELMFYAAVPLADRVVRRMWSPPLSPRSVVAAVVGVGMASISIRLLIKAFEPGGSGGDPSGWMTVVDTSLPALACFFIPGVLCAAAEVEIRAGRVKLPQVKTRWLMALSALLWGTATFLSARTRGEWLIAQPLILVASTTTLAAALASRPWHGLIVRVLRWLGQVSYGLYLWHWIVFMALAGLQIADRAGGFTGWMGNVALVLALSLPVAAASWYLVESPILTQVRKALRGAGSTRVALTPATALEGQPVN